MSDKKKLLSDTNLKEAFDFFDVDKSKTITWDEIARIVFQGKNVPKELVNSFLKEIGKTEKDPITFKEFCEMIRK
jgi:Ca2+-binding EF-hand superfamily protein